MSESDLTHFEGESPALEAADAALLTVRRERLLEDWKAAHERAQAYLEALGVPEADRDALALAAVDRAVQGTDWPSGSHAVAETVRVVRELVLVKYPLPADGGDRSDAFLAWRLQAVLSGQVPPAALPEGAAAQCRGGRFSSMPPLRRGPMVPNFVPHGVKRLFAWLRAPRRAPSPMEQEERLALRRRRHYPWVGAAQRRRALLVILVLIPSIIASGFMVDVLPHQGRTWLEFAIVVFFGALFGWISIGFWTAMFGFVELMRKRDRFAITNLGDVDTSRFDPAEKTAVVMPICEEPVERVFAGLRAIHDSLARTGQLKHFDFFVLSDSSDPATAMREEEAWAAWCRDVGGFGRIFYRRRRIRLKRKSGNVADFCRRWGKAYRYMIMLDADSIMSGETLVRMVQMMEHHPDAGMVQTAPAAVNRKSLLARVQQFAGAVYGPMFAAGLHTWQLGDGQYWGHNTIIRIAAFMEHCGLPRLPGKPPLGGEILSHDFVEAALMGRAGWTLWLAFDLGGSYEEVPSTLLEEMKRDRRWCQGNLQHLRILPTEGMFGAHRALFLNGVLSYVSALLWFCFLGLSTAEAVLDVLREPDYFPSGPSLFPEWPIWRPNWALALMAVTGMILFLPKILSLLLILVKRRDSRAFGGALRLVSSAVLEVLLSSLLAPIRMVFHSRFVVLNLLGRTVSWGSQTREDAETSWREALYHHGLDSLLASAWAGVLYWLNPNYFWWVMPIIGALILSVPVSVLASRVRLGEAARARGLFLTPEESSPPAELREVEENLQAAQARTRRIPAAEQDGFVRAVVDPFANALHRTLLRGIRQVKPSIRTARARLVDEALEKGPKGLAARQRKLLLADPEMVDRLHRRVWELPEPQAALWGRPAAARNPETA